MTASVFLDTNVLVYAYDRSQPAKQALAVATLEQVIKSGRGIISAQVLSEFFSVVTRKLPAPLTVEQAAERIANFLRLLAVVPLTELIVLEAIRGGREHHLSLWDAQIWAAAKLNQTPVILSEDFQHNLILEGIRIVDPFQPEFRVDEWL